MIKLSGIRRPMAVAIFSVVASGSMFANHSWGGYHWARTSNPVALEIGDNVDANWDSYLSTAVSDWNQSTVLALDEVNGGASNPKTCKPTAGRIEVCNAAYGFNQWLGIARIWVSGGHIYQAITKVNDSYFNTANYNTPAWRQMVICQEVGHDFGLDHQDETNNNANLGSCMDYTNDPDGGAGGVSNNDPSNEHPNQHDYAQLETIYRHLDGSNTAAVQLPKSARAAQVAREQFGLLIRSTNGGRTELYELDLGNGHRIFTHVIWAE